MSEWMCKKEGHRTAQVRNPITNEWDCSCLDCPSIPTPADKVEKCGDRRCGHDKDEHLKEPILNPKNGHREACSYSCCPCEMFLEPTPQSAPEGSKFERPTCDCDMDVNMPQQGCPVHDQIGYIEYLEELLSGQQSLRAELEAVKAERDKLKFQNREKGEMIATDVRDIESLEADLAKQRERWENLKGILKDGEPVNVPYEYFPGIRWVKDFVDMLEA